MNYYFSIVRNYITPTYIVLLYRAKKPTTPYPEFIIQLVDGDCESWEIGQLLGGN